VFQSSRRDARENQQRERELSVREAFGERIKTLVARQWTQGAQNAPIGQMSGEIELHICRTNLGMESASEVIPERGSASMSNRGLLWIDALQVPRFQLREG
jgi:hypothetical protein